MTLKDASIFYITLCTFVNIKRDYIALSVKRYESIRIIKQCTYLFLLFSSHYKLCYIIFSLILPTSVPVYFWNEDPVVALFCCFFCRTVIQLNGTWLVNSAAHLYGTRPFDKWVSVISSVSLLLSIYAGRWPINIYRMQQIQKIWKPARKLGVRLMLFKYATKELYRLNKQL